MNTCRAIEYKGKLWIPTRSTTNDECWFIVRAHENKKKPSVLSAYSHIWKAKKDLGCTYAPDVEKTLDDLTQGLYVQQVNPSAV